MSDRRLHCLLTLSLFILTAGACIAGGISPRIPADRVVRTSDGVIVYPDSRYSGHAAAVRLLVVTDNIIRVLSSPEGEVFRQSESLITTYKTDSSVHWDVSQNDSEVVLKTRLLAATVRLSTGVVRFADLSGRVIVAEKAVGGRSFEPAVFDGKPLWHIRQTWQTMPGEALYGLGQHQDGLVNYKGYRVDLFQNNTEVAVPFMVSSRNYGILWDNYSISAVGDVRPYQPLSSLRLFSKNQEEGWLTATYYHDRQHAGTGDTQLPASEIDYAWIGDSKRLLPAAFDPVKGSVVWEGALATEVTGLHLFRLKYAGYLKVYLDGQLVLDRWRQAWNPGTALVRAPLEKGKKVTVRVEWIPDGGESYLSMKWLGPKPAGQEDDISFDSEAGAQLDYYFIYGGNMDEVVAGYRHLTGSATIVPKWAMGLWQSRERYKTENEVLQTVKEFRKRRIPLDNIVLDWSYWRQEEWGSQEFDAARFPSPDSMIRSLHRDYHTHFMISVWPKFYQGIDAYKDFDKNGWLYKRNVADGQRDWIGEGYVSTFYDAFNPAARRGFWGLIDRKLYRKGIDAWWMDASEPDILSNVSPQKRKEQMTPTALGTSAEWLNAYPLENARGIYEGQRLADSSRRVFILTRSGFAGSQRYAAAVWSGDIAARWSDMKNQIAAGINFSLSGIPYWTMDIGGFAVERRFEDAKGEDLEEWREQMTRWYQFGAFCPLFRVHGQYPYREIYHVAPEDHPAYRSMLYYDKLRYRLMPYIYSLCGRVWKDDYTMMRGLAMDFSADTAVLGVADEFLLGPSLLAAPVTTYKARSRDVYLPGGQGWYDFYSDKFVNGGQKVSAGASYERMPVYVKEGSILALGPDLQYTGERPADTITLRVYTGRDAVFSLYEDEGTNYNYEKGAYAIIPLRYDEAKRRLTIGTREGQFEGMLHRRVFRIEWVGQGIGASRGKSLLVNYDGRAKGILMSMGSRAQLPTAQTIASKMKVGWNLGNTLEAQCSVTAWGGVTLTQQMIDRLKASGFNTVRLPCAWDCHATNGVIDAGWMATVKQAVDLCVNNGLYVIINIHWDDGWLENNVTIAAQASVNARQKNYWTQIANYFKSYDEHLLFASANE
ncbi:MAG TPA: TIM-barrel domain-containing protein, partial [Puia sp.]